MILATCQFKRNPDNVNKLYKSWKYQTQKIDRFFFANYNNKPFNSPRIESFHHPLQGQPNVPFMINKGIRNAVKFNKDGLEFGQLIGDDTYPASQKYLEVCCDLIKS